MVLKGSVTDQMTTPVTTVLLIKAMPHLTIESDRLVITHNAFSIARETLKAMCSILTLPR